VNADSHCQHEGDGCPVVSCWRGAADFGGQQEQSVEEVRRASYLLALQACVADAIAA
jgi:hypothetical protein